MFGNINPMIVFSMMQALDKGLIKEGDVKSAIEAINSKDRNTLDGILPIKWDKKDLSKRAFLPWNIRKRNEIDKMSNINSDMMEVVGEYEPNPFKRLAKQTKNLLSSGREKQKQITDGSEKTINDEKDEKTNFRDSIKVNQEPYGREVFILMNLMNQLVVNEKEAADWLKEVELKKENGEISEEEAESLKTACKIKLREIKISQEPKTNEEEKSL